MTSTFNISYRTGLQKVYDVPPELPDCAEVRDDLLNYYGGVMKLDNEAAQAVAVLERAGQLDNTVVI